MNEKSLKNILGLAQRAQRLVSGNFQVTDAISKDKVKILILTTGASPSTVREFEKFAEEKNFPIARVLTKEDLGQCLGKEMRSVAAITDEGFKKSVDKILNNFSDKENE